MLPLFQLIGTFVADWFKSQRRLDTFFSDRLGGCNRCDRFFERTVPAVASTEGAGFVEVNVARDEACDQQPAGEFLRRRVGDNPLRDLDDAAVRDGDIEPRPRPACPDAKGDRGP